MFEQCEDQIFTTGSFRTWLYFCPRVFVTISRDFVLVLATASTYVGIFKCKLSTVGTGTLVWFSDWPWSVTYSHMLIEHTFFEFC